MKPLGKQSRHLTACPDLCQAPGQRKIDAVCGYHAHTVPVSTLGPSLAAFPDPQELSIERDASAVLGS